MVLSSLDAQHSATSPRKLTRAALPRSVAAFTHWCAYPIHMTVLTVRGVQFSQLFDPELNARGNNT